VVLDIMNLFNFLDSAAKKYPDKAAVICNSKRITYKKLKARAEKLASALYSLGITKGTKAGILSFNCIEYIETIFALMKLGTVCVPLNHRLTAGEIKELVEHAGVTTFFYGKQLEEKVPFDVHLIKNFITVGGRQTSEPIPYESLFSSASSNYPSENINEDDESFIIYTAGTTGNPRGVILTHGNQIWNTLNYTAAYSMTPGDIELAPTPLFHTSTLGRVFTYVFNHATFILCKKFSPDECLGIIEKEKVTSLTQAPTMYHMMIKALKNRAWDTRSVTRVVTGASPMTPKAKTELKGLFSMADFFDLYGLTEAGPGVSIIGSADFTRKIDSVGKPMLSVEVRINDEKGNMTPAGQVGEILCQGPNVMKGYYKDPEATAEALRNGWFHTGDMGRIDEEGFLYIVGRKKDIIISGGTNIYPGEVEKVLIEHPAVDDASVIGVPDETWGEKVVAAVVLKQNKPCTEKTIIGFCREHLASFKCPRSVFFTDELPRNAAQKIMKKKLCDMFLKNAGAP